MLKDKPVLPPTVLERRVSHPDAGGFIGFAISDLSELFHPLAGNEFLSFAYTRGRPDIQYLLHLEYNQ